VGGKNSLEKVKSSCKGIRNAIGLPLVDSREKTSQFRKRKEVRGKKGEGSKKKNRRKRNRARVKGESQKEKICEKGQGKMLEATGNQRFLRNFVKRGSMKKNNTAEKRSHPTKAKRKERRLEERKKKGDDCFTSREVAGSPQKRHRERKGTEDLEKKRSETTKSKKEVGSYMGLLVGRHKRVFRGKLNEKISRILKKKKKDPRGDRWRQEKNLVAKGMKRPAL